jgi:lipopolysaccharide transport system ATP-binding protein
MRPIIEVRNLSKRYRLGQLATVQPTLRETLTRGLKYPFDRLSGRKPPEPKILWALQNISFEIQPGEVVGIIGRNGAGKSTLLKVLSRIIKPTTGEVDIYGSVGSLLEIGTGFHPDLTGRENIFLNGAIIGMRREEIRNKFDEIVAFAELEEFLDTPIKYYSSGMHLRLAFAVAAHFEPEILILDEVLAVGDAAFQQKCLIKMKDVSSQGRTIFFVSHDLTSIERMCRRVFLIDAGRLKDDGHPSTVIAGYLETLAVAV